MASAVGSGLCFSADVGACPDTVGFDTILFFGADISFAAAVLFFRDINALRAIVRKDGVSIAFADLGASPFLLLILCAEFVGGTGISFAAAVLRRRDIDAALLIAGLDFIFSAVSKDTQIVLT